MRVVYTGWHIVGAVLSEGLRNKRDDVKVRGVGEGRERGEEKVGRGAFGSGSRLCLF